MSAPPATLRSWQMTADEARRVSSCALRHLRATLRSKRAARIPGGLLGIVLRRGRRLEREAHELATTHGRMGEIFDGVRARLGLSEDVHLDADVQGRRWKERQA